MPSPLVRRSRSVAVASVALTAWIASCGDDEAPVGVHRSDGDADASDASFGAGGAPSAGSAGAGASSAGGSAGAGASAAAGGLGPGGASGRGGSGAGAADGGPMDGSTAPDVSLDAGSSLDGDSASDAAPLDGAVADVSRDARDAAAAGLRFVDVTVAAGISHVQWASQACGPADAGLASGCGVESPHMTGGATAADYDGDGRVDLFATRLDAPDVLYRNLGDGTFAEVGASAGLDLLLSSNGAAFADIDNDGDQDLYVTALGHGRHFLFVNDGSGSFTEEAVARGASVTPAGDYLGTSVAFGDYDHDGYADLHVNEWRAADSGATGHGARLFQNVGSASPGHFVDVTVAAGVDYVPTPSSNVWSWTSTFSDLDGDGFQDLAIAADFGQSLLFWNDGDGTFTDGTAAAAVATDENGMGSAIGDVDGDGDLDWFVTSIFDPDATCDIAGVTCNWGYTGNRLYLNEGSRTFTDGTDAWGVREGFWGWGATFFDYDNDGDLDLVMTNGVDFPTSQSEAAFNQTPMRLWRNDGTTMTEVSALVGLTDTDDGKGLVVLDYDDDGDLDIFVANHAEPSRLYRNDGGNANDWLRVRVEGVESTRDGFGARIEVRRTGASSPMLREVRGGSNFLGHDERVAHFGLGAAGGGPVAEVKITWPSGRVQTLVDVVENQTIDVVEPTGGG